MTTNERWQDFRSRLVTRVNKLPLDHSSLSPESLWRELIELAETIDIEAERIEPPLDEPVSFGDDPF